MWSIIIGNYRRQHNLVYLHERELWKRTDCIAKVKCHKIEWVIFVCLFVCLFDTESQVTTPDLGKKILYLLLRVPSFYVTIKLEKKQSDMLLSLRLIMHIVIHIDIFIWPCRFKSNLFLVIEHYFHALPSEYSWWYIFHRNISL